MDLELQGNVAYGHPWTQPKSIIVHCAAPARFSGDVAVPRQSRNIKFAQESLRLSRACLRLASVTRRVRHDGACSKKSPMNIPGKQKSASRAAGRHRQCTHRLDRSTPSVQPYGRSLLPIEGHIASPRSRTHEHSILVYGLDYDAGRQFFGRRTQYD